MADPGGIQADTGMGESGALRRIERDQVEAEIEQAIEQGCSELVLLGLGAYAGPTGAQTRCRGDAVRGLLRS
jgi:hypothetical protein